MVQINFALKEVNCKVVFYGPGMSGKTTNLEIVHQKVPEENKGELTSISTDGDRTLFFDFMPLDLGNIAGMRTKFQLYTVPRQVYYNSTRKLVLQGVDGVIFISDSDPDKMAENIESYENLIENLREYGKDIRDIPHVIQFNKRDLPNALSVEEMDKQLNRFGVPTFEAVARNGEGVFPTLKVLAEMVLESIERMDTRRNPKAAQQPARAAAAAPETSGEGAATATAPTSGRKAGGQQRQQAATAKPAAAPRQAAAPASRAGTGRQAPAGQPQRQAAAQATATAPAAARPVRPSSRGGQQRAAAAAASGKKGVLGLVTMIVCLVAAAAAGIVWFVMQQPG